MATYRITVVPGDGIGPEVMAEALKVLRAAEANFPGLRFECKEYRAGALCYKETGTDLPAETLEACRTGDAILFGSTGDPSIRFPDGTEIAPQLTLRFVLDLYAGIRPIKRYAGVPSALVGDPAIDYVIMRENVEGLYASRGAGVKVGEQVAVDNMVITRQGTERIVRYAFRIAQGRQGAVRDKVRRVTCVDKANVLKSMAFFRQIFYGVAKEFPGIQTEHAYVDAMTMYMVQRPLHYDVMVAENMFGDIISDLGAATIGGLGVAPSGDIGDHYALFQPSHGTAPDIAGKGLANPFAMILSAGLMLEWLAERDRDEATAEAARRIETAVAGVVRTGRSLTPDLGGGASTAEVGDAVAGAL